MNIPKVRRHAETIAALAATEYQFILAKQSVIAAAALAAAVKGLVKEQIEAEKVINSLVARIRCTPREILCYASHLNEDISPAQDSLKHVSNLPKFSSISCQTRHSEYYAGIAA